MKRYLSWCNFPRGLGHSLLGSSHTKTRWCYGGSGCIHHSRACRSLELWLSPRGCDIGTWCRCCQSCNSRFHRCCSSCPCNPLYTGHSQVPIHPILKVREHQRNSVQPQVTSKNAKQLVVLKLVFKPSLLSPLRLKETNDLYLIS